MLTLYHWKATRSGNAMTVYGRGDAGAEHRVTDVRLIEPIAGGRCIARVKDGPSVMLEPRP